MGKRISPAKSRVEFKYIDRIFGHKHIHIQISDMSQRLADSSSYRCNPLIRQHSRTVRLARTHGDILTHDRQLPCSVQIVDHIQSVLLSMDHLLEQDTFLLIER